MREILFHFVLIIIFVGCGSTTTTFIKSDTSFNSGEFFNSTITVYPPLYIDIINPKYSSYSQKAKSEITSIIKDKIEFISHQRETYICESNVNSLNGIIDKNSVSQIIKNSKTKYVILIKQIFIGNKSETMSMPGPMGSSYSYKGDKTITTIFFEIWKKDKEQLVFSNEISSEVNDGLLNNSINDSFSNIVDEFISNINKH